MMFGLSIWVWIFLILLNGIIFGSFCSNLAVKKGYSSGTWFAGGFFFGIIALIALAGSPVKEVISNLKECPECKEMININANVCRYCGHNFTEKEDNLKECPECKEMVKINANRCKHCGYRFTEEENENIQKNILETSKQLSLYDIKNLIDLGMTDTLISELLEIFKKYPENYTFGFIKKVSDLIIEKGDKRIIPALENLLKDLKNKEIIGIVKNIIEKLK